MSADKQCSKCLEVKPLEDFNKESRNADGRNGRCRTCVNTQRDKHRERERKNSVEWRKKNKEKIKAYLEKTKEHRAERALKYRLDRIDEVREKRRLYAKKFRVEHKDKCAIWAMNRRAKKHNLLNDFTEKDKEEILVTFDYGCCLTGDRNIHWDHVIPISTGHGGTTKTNMIPLRADLNLSKNDSNIFEWFYKHQEPYELNEENFNYLITYLSDLHGMSFEEYKNYVYQCHS